MKKQKNRSWVSTAANAFIASAIADHSPRGSLGERHARKIAARYARETQSIWRAERIKKVLLVSGVIGLIAIIASNWPG